MILFTKKHGSEQGVTRTTNRFLWKPEWFKGEGEDILHWLEKIEVNQTYGETTGWLTSTENVVIIKNIKK